MVCVGTEQWHFSQSDVDQVNQLNEPSNSNDSFCRNSQFVNIRKPSSHFIKNLKRTASVLWVINPTLAKDMEMHKGGVGATSDVYLACQVFQDG